MAEHRGRIQAQGENLEESESWNQDTPPTKSEGLTFLQKLMNKLKRKDKKIRTNTFEKAKKWIEQAAENGGVQASTKKTFNVEGATKERVDIEIIKGTAFVPDDTKKEE